MKCERCGAWTRVAETRQADGGHTLRRTRECANEHRFFTFEVVAPIYRKDQSAVAKALRGIAERVATWKRDIAAAAMVRGGATHAETAAAFGVSRGAITKAIARLPKAGKRVNRGRRAAGQPRDRPP